ncbi:MAG: hypothetical protein IJS14_11515 [Lentisphaeria bacterium]|nr:hypothetical protein [Lentisphaeria bacterium]
MKRMTALLAAGLLALLGACIRTDYESIAEFPPLPSDMRVVIYYDKSQFPVDEKEQVEVGQAVASAYTSSYTLSDIKQKLIRMARSHGANAILVLSLDHKLDGQVRTDQVKNMSGPTWTPVDDSGTDAREQRYMDLYSSAKDGELPVYKITIKAKFYKFPEQSQLKEPVLVPDTPPEKKPVPAKKTGEAENQAGKN